MRSSQRYENKDRVATKRQKSMEKGTHVRRRGTDWKLKFHQARKWENKRNGKGGLESARGQPGQFSLFAAQFHLEGAPAGPIFQLKELHFITLCFLKRELIMSLWKWSEFLTGQKTLLNDWDIFYMLIIIWSSFRANAPFFLYIWRFN